MLKVNFCAPKLSLWLLTVLIIFSSWEFFIYFIEVKLVPCRPRWAERFISSYECWL